MVASSSWFGTDASLVTPKVSSQRSARSLPSVLFEDEPDERTHRGVRADLDGKLLVLPADVDLPHLQGRLRGGRRRQRASARRLSRRPRVRSACRRRSLPPAFAASLGFCLRPWRLLRAARSSSSPLLGPGPYLWIRAASVSRIFLASMRRFAVGDSTSDRELLEESSAADHRVYLFRTATLARGGLGARTRTLPFSGRVPPPRPNRRSEPSRVCAPRELHSTLAPSAKNDEAGRTWGIGSGIGVSRVGAGGSLRIRRANVTPSSGTAWFAAAASSAPPCRGVCSLGRGRQPRRASSGTAGGHVPRASAVVIATSLDVTNHPHSRRLLGVASSTGTGRRVRTGSRPIWCVRPRDTSGARETADCALTAACDSLREQRFTSVLGVILREAFL